MTYDTNQPKKIIVHHSANASEQSQFLAIDKYHKEKFNYVSSLGHWGGYHYLIERNGEVRQYRSPEEAGAHCIGQNDISVGICLAGNFDYQKPTANQIVSLCKLFDYLLKVYQIPANQIFPHRHFSITDCYGLLLSDDWALNQYKEFLIESLLHLLLLLKAYFEKGVSALTGIFISNAK